MRHKRKILMLTKYARLGASSRLRSYQYIPFLENEGFEVMVSPLFPDEYITNLYNKKRRNGWYVIKCYLRRFVSLRLVFSFNIIVIEKELFPYLPSWIELILKIIGKKYIVDYDDAIFHNYDQANFFLRLFLRRKIDHVMRYSKHVIAGNQYIAQRATSAKAAKVTIIPTVINLKNYKQKDYDLSSQTKFVIGWIGTPSTIKYLKQLSTVFENLSKKYQFSIHVIGVNEPIKFTPNVTYLEWSEEKEAELIRGFDVGIMPLKDSLWEKGKCSYKLIQYMASGVSVIASPVGMNREIVHKGYNGFLAENDDNWYKNFEYLILNRQKLKELGLNSRKMVENTFCVQKTIDKYIRVICMK